MKKNKKNSILIGQSDYNKKQLLESRCGWGNSSEEFLERISYYEENNYTVVFETSIWRKIFALGIYKIVAYPN